MDYNISFEEILRKIVREENKALLKSVKELLVKGLNLTNESKHMVFEEACAYIPCSKSTLYKLTSKKLISHAKRGKKLYFIKSELDAWIIENKVSTVHEIKKKANLRILNINK